MNETNIKMDYLKGKDDTGKEYKILPKTLSECVEDADGNKLNDTLSTISDEIDNIKETLESKAQQTDVDAILNNQFPEGYVEQVVSQEVTEYVNENSAGFATQSNINELKETLVDKYGHDELTNDNNASIKKTYSENALNPEECLIGFTVNTDGEPLANSTRFMTGFIYIAMVNLAFQQHLV